MPTAPAVLYIWEDRFLWASRSFKGAMTRRYATNLIVAIAEKPLSLRLPRRRARECRAAVCAAGAERCVDATDTPFLSLNFDPDAAPARALERLAPPRGVAEVDRTRLAPLDAAMRAFLADRLDAAAARNLSEDLIVALTGERPRAAAIEPRVRRVGDALRTQLPRDVDTETLGQLAGVSATRLVHLFSEQYGLPMSGYLLWAKMRRALSLIQSGQSLTEIALRCGFADSSHLTRTFQAFYAVKPSFVADSRYVQVRLC